MSRSPRFNVDVDKAKRIWEEYEQNHDLSDQQNLAVGIDAETGETAKEITLRLVKEGRNKPLFFRWVNNPHYGSRVIRDSLSKPLRPVPRAHSYEEMAMSNPSFELDVDTAEHVWAEYEQTHDLGGMENLAVGIDPQTREVFFGESAVAIGERLQVEGRFRPLFYRWVRNASYFHKGGRR